MDLRLELGHFPSFLGLSLSVRPESSQASPHHSDLVPFVEVFNNRNGVGIELNDTENAVDHLGFVTGSSSLLHPSNRINAHELAMPSFPGALAHKVQVSLLELEAVFLRCKDSLLGSEGFCKEILLVKVKSCLYHVCGDDFFVPHLLESSEESHFQEVLSSQVQQFPHSFLEP